jgi:DNA repair exonuclease SbcCD ATPase subunit
MRNIELTLGGFKRFSLNGILEFSLRMKEPLQIILGTNGCGKSSLLELLSTPLAPSPSAFGKEGFIDRLIEHRGKHYRLKTTFNPTPKYYFEVNGEVLNDWGTGSVQKSLIKEHFGVDNKYHALLCGKERFHQMNPSKRREWFVEICDTDYKYAIGVFNRIKEKLRDTQGALRMIKLKHAQEVQKLPKQEEIDHITHLTQGLQSFLTVLITHKTTSELKVPQLLQDRDLLIQQIQASNSSLLKLSALCPGYHGEHAAALDKTLTGFRARITECSTRLKSTSEQHAKTTELIRTLQQAGSQDIQAFEAQRQQLQNELKGTEERLMVDLGHSDPALALQALEAIQQDLITTLEALPENTQLAYSSQTLNTAREKLAALQKEHQLLSQAQVRAFEQLKHLQGHGSQLQANCPKCSHAFSLISDTQRVAQLQEQLEKLSVKIEQVLQPEIAKVQQFIQVCQEVAQGYRFMQHAQSGSAVLRAYWEIWHHKQVHRTPTLVVNELLAIRADLQLQQKRKEIILKLEQLSAVIQTLNSSGEKDIQQLQQLCAEQAEHIEHATQRLQRLHQRQDALKRSHQLLCTLQKTATQLTQYQAQYAEQNTQLLQAMRITHYDELIRDVQRQLGANEHQLTQVHVQKKQIELMQQQIEQLTLDEKAYSLAAQTLSPTDGLIAEGLMGFIKAFVTQMNMILTKLCTYPMRVDICHLDPDSTELDYKFPVIMHDDPEPREDVSETSKGQKEMIDLAFLITAMSYLRMTDFPLVLDEMGSAFDAQHRVKLIELLKGLVDSRSFDQILMVSHDQHQYTSMAAEICVLDPSNITVPAHYNAHVTIKS